MGEHFLTTLRALGVNDFFANPGTEFAPIIHGFETLSEDCVPRPHLCGHELLALNLAYGMALESISSGGQIRPAAVMTHANVGLANLSIGVIGASRMNVPIVLFAGHTSEIETGLGERDRNIHWSQDSRDQGSLVREYVKFECHLQDPESLEATLSRAVRIATTAPMGVVLITLSRDFLMKPLTPAKAVAGRWPEVIHGSSFRPQDIPQKLVQLHKESRRIVVITNRIGKLASGSKSLIEFSEKHQIGVLTPDDYYASFPISHSCFLGAKNERAFAEADLVYVLDTDVPWYPLSRGPREATIVHIGETPLWDTLPLRSHDIDIAIAADAASVLDALNTMESPTQNLQDRRTWMADLRFESPPEESILNTRCVAQTIGRSLKSGDTIWNELGLQHTDFGSIPTGSYFRSGAASPLGWAIGAALGYSMVDSGGVSKGTLNVVLGDGVLQLSPMLAAIQFFQDQIASGAEIRLRVFVLNNLGLKSIESNAKAQFPRIPDRARLTSFQSSLHYENLAHLCHGKGIVVNSAAELRAACEAPVGINQMEVINVQLHK